jgi:Flp pilus assembly pilin Flp
MTGKFAKTLKSLWKDESAQGATEYILILAVVVGLAVIFKNQIMRIVNEKLGDISGAIAGFKPESGS